MNTFLEICYLLNVFLLKLLGMCYLVVDIVLETASVEKNAMKISVRIKRNEKY